MDLIGIVSNSNCLLIQEAIIIFQHQCTELCDFFLRDGLPGLFAIKIIYTVGWKLMYGFEKKGKHCSQELTKSLLWKGRFNLERIFLVNARFV